MAIRVHVACDDAGSRNVIASDLGAEDDIEVVGASAEDALGAAAVGLLAPDVVVLWAPPGADPAEHIRRYREGTRGPAVVAFCSGTDQAAAFRAAGADGVVLERDAAGTLRAAVKDVYRRRRAASTVVGV
ncbi:MAG TPA: hypothetical protein VF322_03480 [Gammaproteobacteria bacterium]